MYTRRGLITGAGIGLAAAAAPFTPVRQLFSPSANALTGRSGGKPMRFAFGMFMQESNTFCPEYSNLERFKNDTLLVGDEVFASAEQSEYFLGGIYQQIRKLGVEPYPLIAASASPFGIVEKDAYLHITETLYKRLRNAPQLDGIVFAFHGSMVSETTMDPEGEILAEFRKIAGSDIPICATFDFHCKVSPKMVANASAFFFNNENPHRDSFDRGAEAAHACFRIAQQEIDPVMAVAKPGIMAPTLNVRPPTSGPLVSVFERAFELEKDPRVININIGAGFPWCDAPDAGISVVPVVHKDRQLAEDIAQELSNRIWDLRRDFIPSDLVPTAKAVRQAIESTAGPVVLVDVADNPGDGTTQDSNTILRELYKQNAENFAIACIRQPDAVQKCIDAGVGAFVNLELGCPYRVVGEPISMRAKVKTLSDGRFFRINPTGGPGYAELGRTAVVEYKGGEILVTERTNGVANNFPEIFSRHGIDPHKKQILVIKTFKMYSEPHYNGIAHSMIEVDAPGQGSPHLGHLNWKNIPRPMYPIDD